MKRLERSAMSLVTAVIIVTIVLMAATLMLRRERGYLFEPFTPEEIQDLTFASDFSY
jgi:hypothetical protein